MLPAFTIGVCSGVAEMAQATGFDPVYGSSSLSTAAKFEYQ